MLRSQINKSRAIFLLTNQTENMTEGREEALWGLGLAQGQSRSTPRMAGGPGLGRSLGKAAGRGRCEGACEGEASLCLAL